MATIKDTPIEDLTHEDEIHTLNNTDSVIYQKAEAYSSVPMAAISEEVESLGGLEALAGTSVSLAGDTYTIQAPIVIMDDSSFAAYCEADRRFSVRNRKCDSEPYLGQRKQQFQVQRYVPFLTEGQDTILLQNRDDAAATVTIPVLGYYTGAAGFKRRIR